MKPDNQVKVSGLLSAIKEPALLIDPNTQIVVKANEPATAVLVSDVSGAIEQVPFVHLYNEALFSSTTAIILNGRRNDVDIKLDFRLSTIKTTEGEFILAIGREIESEQSLNEKVRLLEREKTTQELRANFVSLTSHELRTPITAISSSLELLESRLEKDYALDGFYHQHIARISTELFNVTTLLDEMLTISNIVSDKYKVVKSAVNAEDVVTYLSEQYFSDRKDGRSLKVKCSGTPRNIFVDKNQLSKILTNLISNAFKFSTEGNPSVKLNYQEKQLVIKVRDTGIGIPPKDLPNLFSAFYRASNAVNIEGSGLGLVIVKTFVDCNDGTISVESENEKGTTFTIGFNYSE
ncbi:HAMP domain-containing histidine kinase [Chitinophaga horti]|uniref:histidine kinase n=1 Tax=Chitinophaga horti TaxID=2920382 RepID=A0ABY6J1Z2_9BACT|nr:HAMP domain-containing sensor histidine kinase [Chitinophaga horti]UYQ92366.1 HAMP domain-containing histidine kinase [Chitinophaga horti]